MEFKLLVLDLDGTTLKSDLTVSPRLKRLIQKLLDTFNLKITIATGRMFEKAKRYIEDICVNAPVIALNGVEIVDHSNGKPIRFWHIDNELGKRVKDILWGYEGSALAITTDKVYLSRYTDVALGSMHDWFAQPVVEYPGDGEHYLCFFAIGETSALQKIIECVGFDTANGFSYDIFPSLRYHPLSYLEIRAKGVSKGSGLRYLREKLGLKKKEILAIGDWTNDITLFNEAGFCATLANGAPQLKEIAHIVSPFTNDEDGVAHIVEEIFFKKAQI